MVGECIDEQTAPRSMLHRADLVEGNELFGLRAAEGGALLERGPQERNVGIADTAAPDHVFDRKRLQETHARSATPLNDLPAA